ncbi:hypothetical protein V6N11_071235 [Hibiscus sabdariffa]|uniref:Reverse transcriptase zinc-binding domain-containing protein n=1 Tax=Hibiscus sabdariffa TaxID=183260 RepID=A0ABR2TZG3_9ROSI
MDGTGNWDLNKLLTIFSATVILHMIFIKCPDTNDIDDKPFWKMNASHFFSIRSAYESLVNFAWDDKSSYWKIFWTLPVPQCLHLFLWLSYKERLMTNVERCRRSIGQIPSCLCCFVSEETTIHVLHDCQSARAVWMNLIIADCSAGFFYSIVQD